MTTDAITQAAERNRAVRAAMLARLQPRRAEAHEKRDAFRSAQSGAKSAQETLDLMRSLSHVPGFFPTPPAVVAAMLEYADLRPGLTVLEPSAGKGDLIRAAAGCTVRAFELVPTLAKICGATCTDFLTV